MNIIEYINDIICIFIIWVDWLNWLIDWLIDDDVSVDLMQLISWLPSCVRKNIKKGSHNVACISCVESSHLRWLVPGLEPQSAQALLLALLAARNVAKKPSFLHFCCYLRMLCKSWTHPWAVLWANRHQCPSCIHHPWSGDRQSTTLNTGNWELQ